MAKPFIKWAGGKNQLLTQIQNFIPENVVNQPFTYIEPFVGGGAMLFWMIETYPNLEQAVINDINGDLTNTYITVRDNVEPLIGLLGQWQHEYHNIPNDLDLRKEYYYEKRALFNLRTQDIVTQSALFIFLNKTGFNGMYRVNRHNQFNIPIGSSRTPPICNPELLRDAATVLQDVIVLNGDFADTNNIEGNNKLFYFDPPYKPLSETSSFTSYAKDEFGDAEQERLRNFCDVLNDQNHHWILSNSDVRGRNTEDHFFDELYAAYNIQRVSARRSLSATPEGRGKLTELLISNQ